ncbi:4-(cytidine 5'-diphospho)-2-C-methyl-D-erythritol kinase [Dialister invisus]|uniref:4-(cytidine 5'-diphospho)-2-C-methyl-D-erythritol kinase n=2 Tax=Dialister invisus TaxID=218538 RepID=UPI0039A008E9
MRRGKANLMWEAAELFFRETGFSGGAHMELVKQIPSEAGMGGGSSDAAAVLRGLNRMTGQQLSLAALADMGAKLGADVPFCVAGGCRRCEGIGEKLTPLAGWAGLPLVIVRPDVSISTGKAYGLLDGCPRRKTGTTESCIEALKNKDGTVLLASLSNDFEDVLFKAEPVLGETFSYLSLLCEKAMMTGAGSAFFLMAENKEQQRKLAAKIKEERPQWYVGMAETIL